MTPTEPRGGEVVSWASEWMGQGGLSRAFHPTEEDAAANAKWMSGRYFALYPRPPVVHGWPEREAVRQRVTEIVEAAIERHAPANSVRHTLDDADAILSLFPPVVGWRGIDTLPRDGQWVVVLNKWGNSTTIRWDATPVKFNHGLSRGWIAKGGFSPSFAPEMAEAWIYTPDLAALPAAPLTDDA